MSWQRPVSAVKWFSISPSCVLFSGQCSYVCGNSILSVDTWKWSRDIPNEIRTQNGSFSYRLYIFLADALVGSRGHRERGVQERVLSALLTEMDGIGVQRDSLSTMHKTYRGSTSACHSQVIRKSSIYHHELCRIVLLRSACLSFIILVLSLIFHLFGNKMLTVEDSVFPFFSSDCSSFVGILTSHQLYFSVSLLLTFLWWYVLIKKFWESFWC